jgi:hypothetical protein
MRQALTAVGRSRSVEEGLQDLLSRHRGGQLARQSLQPLTRDEVAYLPLREATQTTP